MNNGTDTSIRDLLTLAKAGNREAFALFVLKHAGLVRASVRRATGGDPRADVEAGVQQGLLEIWSSLPSFHPQSSEGEACNWVITLASRAYHGLNRRRRPGELSAADEESLTAADEDALNKVCCEEEAVRLRQAIDTLDTRDQEILRLKFTAGFTSEQIGETLGMTGEAVRKALSRAIKKLRDRLDGLGGERT